jgi:hypothetical protein
MGEITTIVFERLQYIQPGSPAADEAAAAAGVLPHISSVVAAAAAEAAAVKAAAAAEAAAAEAAAAEAAAAAAAAGAELQEGGEAAPAAAGTEDAAAAAAAAQQLPAAGQDASVMQQQQQQPPGPPTVLTLATGPIQTAGSLSDSRTPGMAAAVAAAAAAAAAAGASAGGAGRPASTLQEEDAVSDAGATVASSTVAFAESVSGADGVAGRGAPGQASLGGAVSGVPGSLAGLNVGGAYHMGPSTYSHGLPCAVEVLNFLIDCVAQRRLDADGSSGAAGALSGTADDEYAMFGLSMVHRAVLAGGSMLQSHEALLSLLHKDLFAAMVVAVSGVGGVGDIAVLSSSGCNAHCRSGYLRKWRRGLSCMRDLISCVS